MKVNKGLVFCFVTSVDDSQAEISCRKDGSNSTIVLEKRKDEDRDILILHFPFKVAERNWKNVISIVRSSEPDPFTKRTIETLKGLHSVENFSLTRCSVTVVKGKAFTIQQTLMEVIPAMLNLSE